MRNTAYTSRLAKLLLAAASIAAVSVSSAALAQTALFGSDLVIPATPANATADVVLLKTEASGSFNSFKVVITNTGPSAVIGAIVTDKGGIDGRCSKNNPVTITGGGVPEGIFTVANLNDAGITLGTLQPGQTVTFTYSCQA